MIEMQNKWWNDLSKLTQQYPDIHDKCAIFEEVPYSPRSDCGTADVNKLGCDILLEKTPTSLESVARKVISVVSSTMLQLFHCAKRAET